MADIVALYFPHVATAEGPVAHLYLDIYGHLTIGYGHLLLNRKELANKNWRTTLKAEAGRLWGYQLKTIDSRQYNLWTGGKYAPASRQRAPGTQAFVSDAKQCMYSKSADDLAPGPWGLNSEAGSGFDEHRMFLREAEAMMSHAYGKRYPAACYRDFTSFEIASKAEMVRLAHNDIRQKISELKKQISFISDDHFRWRRKLGHSQ